MMNNSNEHLNDLHDIKQMMERSSRFISLSGWSGIAAGICALAGAFFARVILTNDGGNYINVERTGFDYENFQHTNLYIKLILIGGLTFMAALISAFIFTYIRSRKNNTPIWGTSARRLMLNVCIPLLAGGAFLLKLIDNGWWGLVAPGCLLFYGLALLNGSKYTLGEIKYLGYTEIILGIVSCWFIGWGLYFWAVGFGVMHIIYGTVMLYRYERNA